MKYDVSVAPPNSIILVVGSASAEPPESMTGGLTSATSTCVAIGTLNEFDGETSVKIDGGPLGEVPDGWTRRTHRLEGVDGAVKVVDVGWHELLALPWALDACNIVVDTDDDVEPSRIRLTIRAVVT